MPAANGSITSNYTYIETKVAVIWEYRKQASGTVRDSRRVHVPFYSNCKQAQTVGDIILILIFRNEAHYSI